MPVVSWNLGSVRSPAKPALKPQSTPGSSMLHALTMNIEFVALPETLRQRLTAKVSTDEAVDGGREGFQPGSSGLQNHDD